MKLAAPLLSCLLLVAASASFAAEEAKPAAKPDLAKGQATATNVCAACHTSDGSRGSPANPIMQGMAAALSEADMKNVAAFYSSKQPKPGFAKNKDSVALGEKIYRGGIADRMVPACAGCHGPSGAGIPSQYPRLSGQHADYTAAQLNAFRSGARANSAQMTGVAAKMNDKEIKAVSDYIAGLH